MVEVETKAVRVPEGLEAGDHFKVETPWGGSFTIACPEGSKGGDVIAVDLPTFESVAAQIDQLEAVRKFVDELASSGRVEAFLLEHADSFDFTTESNEFPLHYAEVHNEFVALVEALLEQFIESQGLDSESFVQLVERSGSESRDALLRAVCAMTDFETFLGMVNEAQEGHRAHAAAPNEARTTGLEQAMTAAAIAS